MAMRKTNSLWEAIKTVFYAVIIALVVRTFFFEPFTIPSSSMVPTLLVGDYLFVSKLSYGYSRYSLPWGLPLIPGRIFFSPPERGDVVVFKLPTDGATDYVKRVIGLPGDEVQMINGVLHINGTAVKRQRKGDYETAGAFGIKQKFSLYNETLPNGRTHEIIEMTDGGPFDNTGVYKVPSGNYFMMGDNRDSSRDSRFLNEVGFVPEINLIGRADIIFFSISESPLKFWLWPQTIRFDRLFRSIQ